MADPLSLTDAITRGRTEEARRLTVESLACGVSVEEVLSRSLVPALEAAEERFKVGDFYLPELLLSVKATEAAMDALRPERQRTGERRGTKVALGTARGEPHAIGKRMAGLMLEAAGFDVIDLGVGVEPERFVEAAKERGARVVAISATTRSALPEVNAVVRALEEAGIRESVRVLVGGGGVTAHDCAAIGADGYAPDAASAPRVVHDLLGAHQPSMVAGAPS